MFGQFLNMKIVSKFDLLQCTSDLIVDKDKKQIAFIASLVCICIP